MPYFIELGRLPEQDEEPYVKFEEKTAATLEELKTLFKEMNPFNYIPEWLEKLDDPTTYLGVEENIEKSNEEYTNWVISIEGNEYDKEVS